MTQTTTGGGAASTLVVIGASAGGVEAMTRVVSSLPSDVPAAIAAVVHRAEFGPNLLVALLNRLGTVPVVEAANNMPIEPGRLYLPPTGNHLQVGGGRFLVGRGPREHNVRPAIDPLFRTAAHSYRERLIGVILTGTLDDGTSGLVAVKRHGGVTVVQDPADAMYPGMPESALREASVDHVLPLRDIAPRIAELAWSFGAAPSDDPPAASGALAPGAVGDLTCPSCGGALVEFREGAHIHFRCRTGHAFGSESLEAVKRDEIESALWAAIRALLEQQQLVRRMAERARDREQPHVAARYDARLQSIEQQVAVLRTLVSTT